jgi:hypothetical protein
VLGVPNLVPSHESTSSCRFRYLKFIKLITSGPDHAIRYECGHDVHMTYWVSGSNLLRGIQLDEAPTVVFSISNIKERKFSLLSLSSTSVHFSLFFSHSPLSAHHPFSPSVLRSSIPRSHCSCIEFRAAKCSLLSHHSCDGLATSDHMRHGVRAGVWLAFHLS